MSETQLRKATIHRPTLLCGTACVKAAYVQLKYN